MKFATKNVLVGMGGILNSFRGDTSSPRRIKRIVALARLRSRREHISVQSALKRYWAEKTIGVSLAFSVCMASFGCAVVSAVTHSHPFFVLIGGVFPSLFLIGMSSLADYLENPSKARGRRQSSCHG